MSAPRAGRMLPALSTLTSFTLPLVVLFGIALYLLLELAGQGPVAHPIILATILLGSYNLLVDTARSLARGQYALDFIAILAIVVALISDELLVAAVIALMLASGSTLEQFGIARARRSLTKLAERLPNEVVTWHDDQAGPRVKVDSVPVGATVLVRKGEVIALDGVLLSPSGLTDESSLTGEPYEIEKVAGDQLRSGTINLGEPLVMRVTRTGEQSTYRKILEMVQAAQDEKPPLVRLADRYSTWFTLLSLAIAGGGYLLTQSFDRVLAVLVLATPCPLILATPIALLGGVNAAARRRIIVKNLASLEVLSRVDTLVFDKTGTLTLGRPTLARIEVLAPEWSEARLMTVAEAIERNSLHPIAKAIVARARQAGLAALPAQEVQEVVGSGITGLVDGRRYRLAKLSGAEGMAIELALVDGPRLAVFYFEEELKSDSDRVIAELKRLGFQLYIFTGDRLASALKVAQRLGQAVTVRAECTPADKQAGLAELKERRRTVAMVGDGINDAPALAQADVGLVFSNEEQTASSEAADVVFLDGDFVLVMDAITIARQTIRVALQSILWGIGLSIVGMLVAAIGYIPPLLGAFLQEAIDVAVIVNALRASRQD